MMHFTGILIGLISFLSIGVFHPIVIKAEYHFSKSCWPVFLLAVSCGIHSVRPTEVSRWKQELWLWQKII